MLNPLLLATTNTGKIEEFRSLLKKSHYDLVTPKEIGLRLSIIENGASFRENALIKAKAYSATTNYLSLADDSGIEIDALGGMPGIHSARYGGPDLTDKDRMKLVLSKMEHVPWRLRKARFRTSIALAWPNGKHAVREGVLEGVIEFEPKGTHGFGYDPIFYIPSFQCTIGQLSDVQKSQISHRSKAAAKILTLLLT
tara:strand:+ start:1233 stop:1823 length:591 start_codon:yes stop_codon:yes gene_type:complete